MGLQSSFSAFRTWRENRGTKEQKKGKEDAVLQN